MSDNLKDAAAAGLGLLILTGFLNHRAEHAIVHDLAKTVQGGKINATVNGRGMFGLLFGQASTVFISGSGFKSDGFKFRVQRGSGLRAYVARLNLSFTDFTVRDVPVRRYVADFPSVSIDGARVIFDERIIMRTAGEGIAEATVGPEALAAIFARKFPQYKNVKIALRPGVVDVSAEANALGITTRVESSSSTALSEGRYVLLSASKVLVNGKEASPEFVKNLYKTINPAVDIYKDLGLGGYFYATRLDLEDGVLKVRGRALIPGKGHELDKPDARKLEEKRP